MNKKYIVPIVLGSALSITTFLIFLKAINIGEKWRIIGAGISFLGFVTLLIFVLIQMIKDKRKKTN
ncbi:hypothetical protein ACQ33O_04660 [Ferruginibacter sp. SUN002]|uniref:hypothetical protein n=1 Tax=Ferruginibacter sp. SUN002 TaxID=2937789 RepID=UPI003D35D2BF